jgi:hypothetical protein
MLQYCIIVFVPMPVPWRSKAWFCSRTLAETMGSNPAGHGCLSVEAVVFSQLEVSAMS